MITNPTPFPQKVVGFATLIGGITRTTARTASLLPLLMVAMLLLCPVFLNKTLPYISPCFPTYWYLICVYNQTKIPGMLLYIGITYVLSYLISLKPTAR